VPQVIGESLAILRKTGRTHLPWCISNGEEWLFGVLIDEPSKDVRMKKFRLPKLSLNGEPRKEGLELLFKMLIIWTAVPENHLMEIFFK